MTPHFVRVRSNWTVAQALDHFRQYGSDSETMSLIYVIDEQGKLIDDLRIRQILLASPETRIADLMDRRFVALKATDDQVPREVLDAKKQNKTDDAFIIIIDGVQAPYQETITDSNSRVISINFEQGDSNIERIGTTIIPEFATIAIMILAIGIITTVLVTKNKFRIYV